MQELQFWYSVTISCRGDTWEFYDEVVKFLEDYGHIYLVSKEKGKNENKHLQCALNHHDKNTSNIRRLFVTAMKKFGFEPEDSYERKRWLKVKKHDNANILIGYCLKESWGLNMYSSNICVERLEQGREVYKMEKNKDILEAEKMKVFMEECKRDYLEWKRSQPLSDYERSYLYPNGC